MPASPEAFYRVVGGVEPADIESSMKMEGVHLRNPQRLRNCRKSYCASLRLAPRSHSILANMRNIVNFSIRLFGVAGVSVCVALLVMAMVFTVNAAMFT
jgi:hypothetical protein